MLQVSTSTSTSRQTTTCSITCFFNKVMPAIQRTPTSDNVIHYGHCWIALSELSWCEFIELGGSDVGRGASTEEAAWSCTLDACSTILAWVPTAWIYRVVQSGGTGDKGEGEGGGRKKECFERWPNNTKGNVIHFQSFNSGCTCTCMYFLVGSDLARDPFSMFGLPALTDDLLVALPSSLAWSLTDFKLETPPLGDASGFCGETEAWREDAKKNETYDQSKSTKKTKYKNHKIININFRF